MTEKAVINGMQTPIVVPTKGFDEEKKWYSFLLDGVKQFGWVAILFLFIGWVTNFFINTHKLVVERADVEREMQEQISELKGITQILIEDRKEMNEYKFRALEAKVASSSCLKN